jgi:hypothetical protein
VGADLARVVRHLGDAAAISSTDADIEVAVSLWVCELSTTMPA